MKEKKKEKKRRKRNAHLMRCHHRTTAPRHNHNTMTDSTFRHTYMYGLTPIDCMCRISHSNQFPSIATWMNFNEHADNVWVCVCQEGDGDEKNEWTKKSIYWNMTYTHTRKGLLTSSRSYDEKRKKKWKPYIDRCYRRWPKKFPMNWLIPSNRFDFFFCFHYFDFDFCYYASSAREIHNIQ